MAVGLFKVEISALKQFVDTRDVVSLSHRGPTFQQKRKCAPEIPLPHVVWLINETPTISANLSILNSGCFASVISSFFDQPERYQPPDPELSL